MYGREKTAGQNRDMIVRLEGKARTPFYQKSARVPVICTKKLTALLTLSNAYHPNKQ